MLALRDKGRQSKPEWKHNAVNPRIANFYTQVTETANVWRILPTQTIALMWQERQWGTWVEESIINGDQRQQNARVLSSKTISLL